MPAPRTPSSVANRSRLNHSASSTTNLLSSPSSHPHSHGTFNNYPISVAPSVSPARRSLDYSSPGRQPPHLQIPRSGSGLGSSAASIASTTRANSSSHSSEPIVLIDWWLDFHAPILLFSKVDHLRHLTPATYHSTFQEVDVHMLASLDPMELDLPDLERYVPWVKVYGYRLDKVRNRTTGQMEYQKAPTCCHSSAVYQRHSSNEITTISGKRYLLHGGPDPAEMKNSPAGWNGDVRAAWLESSGFPEDWKKLLYMATIEKVRKELMPQAYPTSGGSVGGRSVARPHHASPSSVRGLSEARHLPSFLSPSPVSRPMRSPSRSQPPGMTPTAYRRALLQERERGRERSISPSSHSHSHSPPSTKERKRKREKESSSRKTRSSHHHRRHRSHSSTSRSHSTNSRTRSSRSSDARSYSTSRSRSRSPVIREKSRTRKQASTREKKAREKEKTNSTRRRSEKRRRDDSPVADEESVDEPPPPSRSTKRPKRHGATSPITAPPPFRRSSSLASLRPPLSIAPASVAAAMAVTSASMAPSSRARRQSSSRRRVHEELADDLPPPVLIAASSLTAATTAALIASGTYSTTPIVNTVPTVTPSVTPTVVPDRADPSRSRSRTTGTTKQPRRPLITMNSPSQPKSTPARPMTSPQRRPKKHSPIEVEDGGSPRTPTKFTTATSSHAAAAAATASSSSASTTYLTHALSRSGRKIQPVVSFWAVNGIDDTLAAAAESTPRIFSTTPMKQLPSHGTATTAATSTNSDTANSTKKPKSPKRRPILQQLSTQKAKKNSATSSSAVVAPSSPARPPHWSSGEINDLLTYHSHFDPSSSSFWHDIACALDQLPTKNAAECQRAWNEQFAATPIPASKRVNTKKSTSKKMTNTSKKNGKQTPPSPSSPSVSPTRTSRTRIHKPSLRELFEQVNGKNGATSATAAASTVDDDDGDDLFDLSPFKSVRSNEAATTTTTVKVEEDTNVSGIQIKVEPTQDEENDEAATTTRSLRAKRKSISTAASVPQKKPKKSSVSSQQTRSLLHSLRTSATTTTTVDSDGDLVMHDASDDLNLDASSATLQHDSTNGSSLLTHLPDRSKTDGYVKAFQRVTRTGQKSILSQALAKEKKAQKAAAAAAASSSAGVKSKQLDSNLPNQLLTKQITRELRQTDARRTHAHHRQLDEEEADEEEGEDYYFNDEEE